jgi:hypothetical protein
MNLFFFLPGRFPSLSTRAPEELARLARADRGVEVVVVLSRICELLCRALAEGRGGHIEEEQQKKAEVRSHLHPSQVRDTVSFGRSSPLSSLSS